MVVRRIEFVIANAGMLGGRTVGVRLSRRNPEAKTSVINAFNGGGIKKEAIPCEFTIIR